MSTPEDRTRREPEVRDREVVEDTWREDVNHELRLLRNSIWGVALLAAIALGLGIYLVINDDDDNGDARDGASQAQVQELEDRVDELGSQLENAPGRNAINQLDQQTSRLAGRLDEVEQQAGQDNTDQLEQSINDLSSDLEQLSQRVDEIEQEQQQQQGQ